MGEVVSFDDVTWKMLLSFKKNIKFFSKHPEVYAEALKKTQDLFSQTIGYAAA